MAVAAQFWINGMVYASIIPRLPELRDRLGVDVSVLGLVLTLSAVGGLISSAVAGPAIGRFGTRRVIIGGTVLTIVVLPIVGLTGSVATLALALAAIAWFDVVIDIAMNLQGSRLSARRTTPVMNRLHGLWSLGTVVGGLIAVRAAADGVELWVHFIVVSVVLGVVLMVSSWFLLSDDETPTAVADRETPAGRGGSSARAFALLGLLGAAAVSMEMTTADWASFRLADDLQVEPGRVGLGFVAFTCGMVTGRFFGDTIQALIGPARLARWAAVLAAVGIAAASLPPGSAIDSGSTLLVVSLLGYYVAALGVSVVFPQLYDAAAQANGPPGRALGALTAGTKLAGVAAPILVGLIADSRLSVGVAVAVVTLPGCVLIAVYPRPSGS